MCGSSRIFDPLNITNGHGVDMVKPWGGWKTKLDPAGLMDKMTPKAPQVNYEQPKAAPKPPPVQQTSSSTGLQISAP